MANAKGVGFAREEEVTNGAGREKRIVAFPLTPAPSDGGKRESIFQR